MYRIVHRVTQYVKIPFFKNGCSHGFTNSSDRSQYACINETHWHYEIQAGGAVKKDLARNFFEEYLIGWTLSHGTDEHIRWLWVSLFLIASFNIALPMVSKNAWTFGRVTGQMFLPTHTAGFKKIFEQFGKSDPNEFVELNAPVTAGNRFSFFRFPFHSPPKGG
jgi:hypothetical protein